MGSGAPKAEADPSTTVSSIPMSRESQVLGKERDEESAWLDSLLVAMCETPVDRGETAAVIYLVRAIGLIFRDSGIGACIVAAGPAEAASDLGVPVEQQIFRFVPEGAESRGQGMVDPTRLFPGFTYERVIEIEATGSTLHLATDDAQVEDDESPMIRVASRAALVIGRALVSAREHARAMSDARDLRELHAHMVQAEKLASVGQIAAGVVHELNNPLTSIVAYTDWLTRTQGKDGDADVLERLKRIGESATRILRFTRDLVTYARPSSEVFVHVSLHNVMDQALAFCEHVIADHDAMVTRAYSTDLPPIYGMSEQLVQVFVNLFTNACHALPSTGGRLTVRTELAPGNQAVIVIVEDNGHGIAPEHIGQIFFPFFTTKVDGRGTGLGLSIVKNIVDNHGGDIRADRGSLGGAKFILTFPVAG